MKTYQTLTFVLALAVVVLAGLLLSGKGKTAAPVQPQEMWHTNTVQLWHTNTVEKWRTNATTVQVPVTNTVLQTVTNQVVKEVPANISSRERDIAAAGYKFLNAPLMTESGNTLYKAGPVTVDLYMGDSAAKQLGNDADGLKKNIEAMLREGNVPLADNSPYRLKVELQSVWNTGVPDVSLLISRLELRENVVVQRQNQMVKCNGCVWGQTTSRLARNFDFPDEAKSSLKGAVARFCKDYASAAEKEPEVTGRMTLPRDFLSGR